MKNKIAALVLACALGASTLAGCGQATYSQLLGDAKVELNGLEGTTEGDFELPYTSIAYDVELESGTVDVEILDVLVTGDDDDADVTPLDVIHEAKGLSSGDHETLEDDDGNIYVRITSSDGAKGTISFSEG